jgi:hypothetical protein
MTHDAFKEELGMPLWLPSMNIEFGTDPPLIHSYTSTSQSSRLILT